MMRAKPVLLVKFEGWWITSKDPMQKKLPNFPPDSYFILMYCLRLLALRGVFQHQHGR